MNTDDSYNESTRSDHCPLLRSGPALGCSFCWNTIDARGRFLRRKTKYHCPECNINLCLVPCFQVIILCIFLFKHILRLLILRDMLNIVTLE